MNNTNDGEDYNQKNKSKSIKNKSNCHHAPKRPLAGGILIILIGLGLLLSKIPGVSEAIPNWLFTWPTVLIIVGIFIWIKNGTNLGGAIVFLVGLFFLINNGNIFNVNLAPYFFPSLVILAGVVLVINRKKHINHCRHRLLHHRYRRGHGREQHSEFASAFHNKQNWQQYGKSDQANTSDDYLEVSSIFGSTEKNYFSKKFKGGNVVCVFGGGKINLIQSDIEDVAILNFSINFGGAEVIVPSNWKIKNELNALLGGIEDKRYAHATEGGGNNEKILILRGNVFCGGIEIRT